MKEPAHDDADQFADSPPTDNPVESSFDIVVSVPRTIVIRMVDASALADYEIWFFIASLLASAVIGFLVAYIQALDGKSTTATPIGWMTLVLGILFALSVIVALYKRTSLRKKGKDVKLRTTRASTRQTEPD